jgi:hypothetical protein
LSLIVPLADLSEYEGGGSDSFSVVSAGGTYGGSASPGVFFSGNATASGVTTITYTYSVVSATPEPTTMVLFGSALVGLGLLRKRIRS